MDAGRQGHPASEQETDPLDHNKPVLPARLAKEADVVPSASEISTLISIAQLLGAGEQAGRGSHVHGSPGRGDTFDHRPCRRRGSRGPAAR